MRFTHSILFALPLLAIAQYGAFEDISQGNLMARTVGLKYAASKVMSVNHLNNIPRRYHKLAWNKVAEKYVDGKDPAGKAAAEAAAHAGILHGEKTKGWGKDADYAIRSNIHPASTPEQEEYFPDHPGQKWVTVQQKEPWDKFTKALHIPVDAQGKYEDTVPVFSKGQNKNKGMTAAPGTGSVVNLPQRKRWLYERALENVKARYAALEDFDTPIYVRNAYPEAEYKTEIYTRDAYAEPDAFFEKDEYEY
ncbi:hypothetical protein MMC17_002792 [Xylographa soralifera]|nr:hypothetical protein [Xylographa soralifera]